MAALSEIRELEAVFKTRGVDEGLAKLRALAGAEDAVAQGAEKVERSTRSLSNAQEKLNRTLDQNYSNVVNLNRATADLEALRARDMISVDRHAMLLQRANERWGQVGKGAKLAGHEVSQIGAQIMDFGVQVASGQGLFMPLIQQGGQLTGMLGDRGLKGAFGALGSGIMAFVSNPLNLALVGAAGLTAAAGYAWDALSDGRATVETLDEVFARHEATLKRVEGAYAGITKGIGGLPVSPAQASAALYGAEDSARAARLSASKDLAGQLGYQLDTGPTGALEIVRDQYFRISDAVAKFRQQAQKGPADFNALHEAVSRLYIANPTDAGIAALWKDIDKATEAGRLLQERWEGLEKVRQRMDAAGGPGMYRAGVATDALMQDLPALGASDPFKDRTDKAGDALAKYRAETQAMLGSPLDQAIARETNSFAQLQKQLEGTRGSMQAINVARAAFDQRVGAIRARFTEDGLKISTGPSAFDREVRRAQDRMRDMESEISMFGRSRGDIAAFRLEQDLLAAATEKGAVATDAQRRAVAALSSQMSGATEALGRMKLEADLNEAPHADPDILACSTLTVREMEIEP